MPPLPSPRPLRALRGEIVHFLGDPAELGARAIEQFTDGVLLVQDGRIAELGPAAELLARLPADLPIDDYRGHLILPGFIDTHTHYAQIDVVASYGEQLLTWLQKYTFPAEARFADPQHASAAAAFFCNELLRNGTTTACVFATVHSSSVDALFMAAQRRNMRLITGKVLMDRNCPPGLRDTAETGELESRQLIERWHGRDRLLYALTPRFPATSSDGQMRMAARLFAQHPGLHLQSHLAESRSEIDWVAALYPHARSYLDVFAQFGQLGPRSVFAHGIGIDDEDRARMAATGAALSFCPSSNLFLGSGLFDLERAGEAGIRVGIGTDIGAGTSVSMLRTLGDAYKVLQLQGQSLAPERAFYLATLGGARSLYLDDRVGSFAAGREADLTVLDTQATPLLARRIETCSTLAERLFALMTLGDDRCVRATHILGEPAWQR
ncbi:MAG: guanine deaminase [Thauera sp.]|nr:guanine deaminase [Thauera sp.]